ncbi:zinc finger MYM-type protein 1-like [Leptopilina boulardi]|uniref:zinc finger MYM-type protein 1-like n=1 Tax=Leptopilina boulardi TaxID=63433 RepID=UPI0021F5E8EC|nr:zinc finger MYM-type protein 1-like [Leptopilina boulardi]
MAGVKILWNTFVNKLCFFIYLYILYTYIISDSKETDFCESISSGEEIISMDTLNKSEILQNSPSTIKSGEDVVCDKSADFPQELVDVEKSSDSSNIFPDVITDKKIKLAIILSGPNQPPGPFPRDENQENRSFSNGYYFTIAKSGLKLNRNWLCYSSELDCVYCQPCWLFPQEAVAVSSAHNVWIRGVRDWRHLSERIKSHETSQNHTNSCLLYEQWRKNGPIEKAFEEDFKRKQNFWRKVIERLLDVTLMMASCNLAFRGSCENIQDRGKGNFLSIVQLLAKYDPILQELLELPNGSVNYLGPKSQNEFISVLSKQVLNEIENEIRNALFFSIILDSTQDKRKVDQLSQVFRYVKIVYDSVGKPLELKICEVFTGFREINDPTAKGLADLVLELINEKNLQITKCCGQAYDGAAVMSGELNGLQKRIREIAPYAYFVYCTSHKLNLILNDAVSQTPEITRFFESVQDIYNYFGKSIVRWKNLQFSNEDETSKTSNITLKTLNPTRWVGRYDAVYALKVRLGDVLKNLSRIVLTSKKPDERNAALGLQKKIERLEFILLLIIQCKILEKVNIASKALQSKELELSSAHDHLENAYSEVANLRNSFGDFRVEASELCAKLNILDQFEEKRKRRKKKHFEELCEDERLTDPEKLFKVSIFYPMIDSICSQLKHRFEGMHLLLQTYKVVQPQFIVNASEQELTLEAEKFVQTIPEHISRSFPAQLLSIKSAFSSEIKRMKTVKQLADFLIIENSSLMSNFSDVYTACIMYLTIPVTVASAERSFSKLNLIRTYLRTSMGQERLSELAILSIENERARKIDFTKTIDDFATMKSRKKSF